MFLLLSEDSDLSKKTQKKLVVTFSILAVATVLLLVLLLNMDYSAINTVDMNKNKNPPKKLQIYKINKSYLIKAQDISTHNFTNDQNDSLEAVWDNWMKKYFHLRSMAMDLQLLFERVFDAKKLKNQDMESFVDRLVKILASNDNDALSLRSLFQYHDSKLDINTQAKYKIIQKHCCTFSRNATSDIYMAVFKKYTSIPNTENLSTAGIETWVSSQIVDHPILPNGKDANIFKESLTSLIEQIISAHRFLETFSNCDFSDVYLRFIYSLKIYSTQSEIQKDENLGSLAMIHTRTLVIKHVACEEYIKYVNMLIVKLKICIYGFRTPSMLRFEESLCKFLLASQCRILEVVKSEKQILDLYPDLPDQHVESIIDDANEDIMKSLYRTSK